MSNNIIPFGKYKGRTIEEVLTDDPSYLQWCAGQDWFRARFNVLYQVIINRGAEPEETPEHNALQVLFLDDTFCLKFCQAVGGGRDAFEQPMIDALQLRRQEQEEFTVERVKETTRRLESTAKQLTRSPDAAYEQQLHSRLSAELHDLVSQRDRLAVPVTEIQTQFRRDFEAHGVDVELKVLATSVDHPIELQAHWHCHGAHSYPSYDNLPYDASYLIEIKPAVGDDYPAVLRQMRANNSSVLLIGDYTGVGATRGQFIKTFAAASIKVVFLADVEGLANAE